MTLRRGVSALLMGAAVLGGSAGSATGADRRTVELRDVAFSPEKLRVRSGTTVVFRWRHAATPHNVRSRGRLRFPSTGERTRGTHAVRLTRRGTYPYVCTIHPGMSGSVVVR